MTDKTPDETTPTPVNFVCPKCGVELNVDDDAETFRCPGCHTALSVGQGDGADEPHNRETFRDRTIEK